ncbi:uncharacterized protein [Pyxicephalus adspersus]|uniref:uncharacterized protein isoform X2 n=1 Tax=Pyxicephalus adspersus TaxID=30357 RepID=UPI003B5CB373
MDEVLMSEIVLVVLEREDGVPFEEFAGLFHQVHGYQLKLANYGFKSLKDLLDNMKDVVEIQNVNEQQLIKYRPPLQPNVIPPSTDTSFQINDSYVSEACAASSNTCWPQTDFLLTGKINHTPNEDPTPTMLVDGNSANQKSVNTTQKPSDEIVKIISERVIDHHFGLRAELLRKYVLLKHNINLELYSQQLGYTDMRSMLKQIPGIHLADNSSENILYPLGPKDKYQNSQPTQPKIDLSFLTDKVVDILRSFPSGLKVDKLKQHLFNTHRIDLEVLSQRLGYTDIPSMLKQVPDITSLDGNVFIALYIQMVDFVRNFPSGLKIEKLSKHIKNQYKINLMKLSQEKGFTDVVSMLQNIPGITVVNKNVIIASHVSNSKSTATCKTTPAKCPKNVGNQMTKKTCVEIKTGQAKTSTKSSTTRPTGNSQQIFLHTPQIPSTNNMINTLYNVQPGLRPNVSYASACASNLRKDQVNVHALQCPPSFNVQKANTAKTAHFKELPKHVLSSSQIKDNLQLLLKSHANGLSIFQLKKLYLLKFQEPLVRKGLSVTMILMDMKDVAKIKGVGVQMKVLPTLVEDNASASAAIYRVPTPQGAAALEKVASHVFIKNSTENIKQSVPKPLKNHQPSSLVYINTSAGHIPNSSEDIRNNQPLNQNHIHALTEVYGKTHPANNSFATGSPFSKMNEFPQPPGITENFKDAEWPPLPQKFNILKEIHQRLNMSDQLHENITNNEICCKQDLAATFKSQGEDNTAQTSMQPQQDSNKMNGSIDNRHQEPQTLDPAQFILPSGFSFVMEDTGFSFVKGETNVDVDTKSKEISRAGASNPFPDSAHLRSANFNQSSKNKVGAPEHSKKSRDVLPKQKMAEFSSKTVPQQTNNHPVIPGTKGPGEPNQKTKNVKPLLSEPKTHQATSTSLQTGLTSLKEKKIQPCCDVVQMVSVTSNTQQEASSFKSICDCGQKGFTHSPSKLEVTKSDLSNRCELTGSPKSPSPEKVSNLETKTLVGSQHIPTEKNLSGTQTSSNIKVLSAVPKNQQKMSINPSVNTEGSPISHTLHNDISLTNATGQIDFIKQRKKEHSQTRDEVDGSKTPPLSAQQKSNIGQVYTHKQTVTDVFQIQPNVPHLLASSSTEHSRSSPETHQYCNGIDDRASGQKKTFTSKSYQHVLHSLHVAPVLSEFQMTPCDQQESSEESTNTWQTDGAQYCCIL